MRTGKRRAKDLEAMQCQSCRGSCPWMDGWMDGSREDMEDMVAAHTTNNIYTNKNLNTNLHIHKYMHVLHFPQNWDTGGLGEGVPDDRNVSLQMIADHIDIGVWHVNPFPLPYLNLPSKNICSKQVSVLIAHTSQYPNEDLSFCQQQESNSQCEVRLTQNSHSENLHANWYCCAPMSQCLRAVHMVQGLPLPVPGSESTEDFVMFALFTDIQIEHSRGV